MVYLVTCNSVVLTGGDEYLTHRVCLCIMYCMCLYNYDVMVM